MELKILHQPPSKSKFQTRGFDSGINPIFLEVLGIYVHMALVKASIWFVDK